MADNNLSTANSIINENTVVLSKETIKRLLKDVKEMMKHPLVSHGIYYKHDESNILKGYVYICGPADTQYFGGNYFFEFNFPYDYPHRPPIVEFKTKDSQTRFHPNMYRSGKMCLSILNTWKGDQWTGCQSIRSILLTILSILDDKPLLHEPGFTESHKDCERYNKIIKYRNFDFSINQIITNKVTSISFYTDLFKEDIISQFHKNKDKLVTIIEELKDLDIEEIKTGIYNLCVSINWKNVYSDFNLIKI